MSKASVKKALSRLDRDALRELLLELYTSRREARDYLEFWVNPDMNNELEQTKLRVRKIFFTSATARRKPDLTELKTLLRNFESLCPDPEHLIDLLLTVPETYMEWVKARNGIGMKAARPRIDKAIETADQLIRSSGFEQEYAIRLARLREDVDTYYEKAPQLNRRQRRWFRW